MAGKSSASSTSCPKCDIPKSCANCNLDAFRAERLDFWESAKNALMDKDAGWGDEYNVDPQDVLALAMFLSGDLPS